MRPVISLQIPNGDRLAMYFRAEAESGDRADIRKALTRILNDPAGTMVKPARRREPERVFSDGLVMPGA